MHPIFLSNADTILYDEEELISTQAVKKPKSILSDIATNVSPKFSHRLHLIRIKIFPISSPKELIATLNTSGELNSDWEVVFPDCPLYAKTNDNSSQRDPLPYAISGEKWKNDDHSESYTYCWPMDWLPFDVQNLRIIGINYETALTEWSAKHTCPCEKGNGTLRNRSDELIKSLVAAGLGK